MSVRVTIRDASGTVIDPTPLPRLKPQDDGAALSASIEIDRRRWEAARFWRQVPDHRPAVGRTYVRWGTRTEAGPQAVRAWPQARRRRRLSIASEVWASVAYALCLFLIIVGGAWLGLLTGI